MPPLLCPCLWWMNTATIGILMGPPFPSFPPLCRYIPLDPGRICLSKLGGCAAAPDIIQLSEDQLLLAAACGNTLHLYSMPDLAAAAAGGGVVASALQAVQPIRSLVLPVDTGFTIRSVIWQRNPAAVASAPLPLFLVLTDENLLLLGSNLGTGLGWSVVAECVEAAAWAPYGSATFTYVEDSTTLVFAQQQGTATSELSRVPISHSDGGQDCGRGSPGLQWR